MESIFPKRGPTALLICALLALWGTGTASGLSLPWFSEDSAVERVLNKIWYAMLNRDVKSLKQSYLTGLTVDYFLKREMDQINRMGIQQVNCRIKKMKLDPVGKQWAWVEFDKSTLLKNGQTLTAGSLAVFKKENGYWKLFTGAGTRRKDREQKQPEPSNRITQPVDKQEVPEAHTAKRKGEQVPTGSEPYKFEVTVSKPWEDK